MRRIVRACWSLAGVLFLLVSTVPANAATLADTRSVTIFLSDKALSAERPAPDAKTLNRSITQLVPLLPVGEAQRTEACGATKKPPEAAPAAPALKAGCAFDWGSWSPPLPLKLGKPLSTASFREFTLTLWLNASEPVALLNLSIQLLKSTGLSEVPLFGWTYDLSKSGDGSDGAKTARTHAGLLVGAQDPETQEPILAVYNKSVPLQLRSGPLGASKAVMTVNPGQSLVLRFSRAQAVALNATTLTPETGDAVADLRVEFGGLERPSAISGFIESASPYFTAAGLGLFLASDDVLSYAQPTGDLKQKKTVEYVPNFNRTFNVTLGSAIMDQTYLVQGNALVYLFAQIETGPGLGSVSRNLPAGSHGHPIKVKVELDLLVEDDVVTSGTDSLRVGTEHCLDNNLNAPRPCDVGAMVLTLPAAGLVFRFGTTVTVQARFVGLSDEEIVKVHLWYGSSSTPSGVKIPANDDSQVIDPADIRLPPPELPNQGAGHTVGNFTLEANRVTARAGAGAAGAWGLSVKSTSPNVTFFTMDVTDVAPDFQALLEPDNGTLFPQAAQWAALTVTAPEWADVGSFEFHVRATFTDFDPLGAPIRTVVGPLNLTLVVDAVAGTPGDAAAAAGAEAGPGTASAQGGGQARSSPKVISGGHNDVPAPSLILALASIAGVLAIIRRRAA